MYIAVYHNKCGCVCVCARPPQFTNDLHDLRGQHTD